MAKYLVLFDSNNCPAITVINGPDIRAYSVISVVAEFDGDEHLHYDINHNVLVKFHVVEYKPRNPESPRVETKLTLFVHRDRIVSISHIPSGPRQ